MTNLEQQPPDIDPEFNKKVERLHRITVYGRWLVVGLSWLILAPLGIWGLREEISLWVEHFTWAAVRYGLAYNRIAAVCLAFCMGMTTAVLVWQSRNILFGLPQQERQKLAKKVRRIQAKGPTHPLWKWVCGSRSL